MNLFQLISMMKQGGNPQQAALQMLQKNAGGNPMANNVLNMARNGDSAGLENFARNICAGKGIDFNQAFNNFKANNGL